jgi:hypothetical protein
MQKTVVYCFVDSSCTALLTVSGHAAEGAKENVDQGEQAQIQEVRGKLREMQTMIC